MKCGAIANAANSQMLGCFHPNHNCIDNAIYTFAGIQLRATGAELMVKQGHDEETEKAKITPAFNLPCDYVLHTVGPIIQGAVKKSDEDLLESCYKACLALSKENNIQSVAFCCISTGVFSLPNELAAKIAVETVRKYRGSTEVIFNVFKQIDYDIYRDLLGKY